LPGRLVYVVDDDPLLAEALASFLSLSGWIVEWFVSADAFKEQAATLHPGVVLLDVRMKDTGGIQFLERWPSLAGRHAVIVLTGHGDIRQAVQALRSGALNFFEKPLPPRDLLAAVEEAFNYLAARETDTQKSPHAFKLLSKLTDREKQVLLGVSMGKSNKAIAHEIGISYRTVEMHRANMMMKLKARNVAELLALALTFDREDFATSLSEPSSAPEEGSGRT